VTHPFKARVNSVSGQYWGMHVDVFLNSLMYNHCASLGFFVKTSVALYICFVFIWHIPHPTVILTNFGSREYIIM
jgi:hypothetical protein